MRLHGDLEHINYVVVCVCMCLDGTARRTPVRFSRAHPSIGAQAEGSGFPEKHQCTGPSPAYSARLAPAINQPSHSTAHTAEGASRGLRHRHNTHPLLPFLMHSQLRSVISCVVLQTFLVRKSRTSQRNVLCVRLTDDSVPSFVQQFGIREEQGSKHITSTLGSLWKSPLIL